MIRNLLFLFSVTLQCGCNSMHALDDALDRAGRNRPELEKVLAHYGSNPGDSLKYRAACFLIENMPFHYSFQDSALIARYHHEIDSVLKAALGRDYGFVDSVYRRVVRKYASNTFHKVSDLEVVTAEYLICNIDLAFSVWGDNTWSEHLDFDRFCEYILPYKVMDGQLLDDWRPLCLDSFNESLQDLRHCPVLENDPYSACNKVGETIRKKASLRINGEYHLPITRIATLLRIPWGSCEDHAFLTAAVMNAKGIPCAVDFTPQWPFRSMGHSWNVLLERSVKTTVFENAGTPVGTPHKKDHKMAKVYRRTYAANRELVDLLQSEKQVPATFQTPFLKDVTDEYMQTQSLALRLYSRVPNRYAYLAIFDNARWQPVCWGRVRRGKATFEKIGRDVVYLPVTATPQGLKAVHDPVLVDIRGQVQTLTADTSAMQSLRLYRKHPALPNTYGECLRMRGAVIEASDRPDFSNADTIHCYDDYTREIFPDRRKRYRYWRYLSAPYGFVNVAELAFFERDSLRPAKGVVIGTSGSYRPGNAYAREAVFDGDLLTFFDAPDGMGGWVGMDFGHPIDVGRITAIMRGDGNEIEIGNEYELFYWQDGGWRSLGRQTASDICLTYEKCPSNALFLLHNRTKGQEERIFTYENARQRWW